MAWAALHQKRVAVLPALRPARWLFLALGIAALGYVAWVLLDAKLFQAYEGWRLDQTLSRAVKASRPSAPAAPPPPAPTLPTASSAPARRVEVAPGSVLGRIEIGRVGVDVIIAEGTDTRTLQRAVGHITGTALPGEPGNVGLAGHRDTFFRALSTVRQDDEITLTTLEGSYRYRVDAMTVVEPKDTEVLNDTGGSTLTLVTCYPFYYVGPAPKRFIVRAHLEGTDAQRLSRAAPR